MSREILAFICSAIGVGGSLPQLLKILRTKETKALSYGTYCMLFSSSILWVTYGIITPVYSIVFWNSLSAIFAISILVIKIRNEKPKGNVLFILKK